MRAIEIDGSEIAELLEEMPPELRKLLTGILKRAKSHDMCAIEAVKHWVKRYDDDCPVDQLIAKIVASNISDIGRGINKALDKAKERDGKKAHITSIDALRIAVKKLREQADSLTKIANEVEAAKEDEEDDN